MSLYNLVSVAGIFILVGFAWLISSDRRNVNYRVIIWRISLQLLFGAFIFLLPAGAKVFLFINDIVVKVLGSASAGAEFLFGRLALPPGARNAAGEGSLGFFLAFQALPTIIFFSALMSILYYTGVMPRVIRGFSSLFSRLMRVSGAESVSVASNIFVGIESLLTIKPYLDKMTRSELCTVLTAVWRQYRRMFWPYIFSVLRVSSPRSRLTWFRLRCFQPPPPSSCPSSYSRRTRSR